MPVNAFFKRTGKATARCISGGCLDSESKYTQDIGDFASHSHFYPPEHRLEGGTATTSPCPQELNIYSPLENLAQGHEGPV